MRQAGGLRYIFVRCVYDAFRWRCHLSPLWYTCLCVSKGSFALLRAHRDHWKLVTQRMDSPAGGPPVVIVGAGAAGLMAAIWAAAGTRPVLLLEGSTRPGQKILISGGGRCNVLPAHASPDDFHTDGSRHTLAKILRAWPLAAVRRFFEADLAVPLRLEEETGKLFPVANRASAVLEALWAAATQRGVAIRQGSRMSGLDRAGDGWQVQLDSGEVVAASRVVLATGGLSVPATGSDGLGLRIAQGLGHGRIQTYPALVPLTSDIAAHHALAGVSLKVTLTVQQPSASTSLLASARGGFLFTHRGYSGPAVLNVSHVASRSTFVGGPRPLIYVQWTDLDAAAWDAELRSARGPVVALLRRRLPERLAAQLAAEAGAGAAELPQLRREDRARLVEILARYPLPWSGHEGYKTAEVTGGGVPLSEVNPATLESRLLPGLYLCGEILDAFGPIGGYNFLWAWVTGRIAGEGATR
jgi:predicted Rossmann fold flavoprotein